LLVNKNDDYLRSQLRHVLGESLGDTTALSADDILSTRCHALAYLILLCDLLYNNKYYYNRIDGNNIVVVNFRIRTHYNNISSMSLLSLLLTTRPDGDTSVAAPVTAYRPRRRRRRRRRFRRDDRDDAHAAARTDHRGGLVCTRRHVDRRLSVVRLSPTIL